jgi:hypothetical protein
LNFQGKLARIELSPFEDSSLRLITLPQSVGWIDGSTLEEIDSVTISNDYVNGHSPRAVDITVARPVDAAQRPVLIIAPLTITGGRFGIPRANRDLGNN